MKATRLLITEDAATGERLTTNSPLEAKMSEATTSGDGGYSWTRDEAPACFLARSEELVREMVARVWPAREVNIREAKPAERKAWWDKVQALRRGDNAPDFWTPEKWTSERGEVVGVASELLDVLLYHKEEDAPENVTREAHRIRDRYRKHKRDLPYADAEKKARMEWLVDYLARKSDKLGFEPRNTEASHTMAEIEEPRPSPGPMNAVDTVLNHLAGSDIHKGSTPEERGDSKSANFSSIYGVAGITDVGLGALVDKPEGPNTTLEQPAAAVKVETEADRRNDAQAENSALARKIDDLPEIADDDDDFGDEVEDWRMGN